MSDWRQKVSSLRKKWNASAFLLPEGPLDLIARLTGLLGLLSAWDIYNHFGWLRAEYRVQSWWVNDWCLDLPCNEALSTASVCLCGIASLAMLSGYNGKLAPLVVALTAAYLSSLDATIAFPHSLLLTIWICIALLFRRSPVSISRGLIQLSMIACYGFSALQKLLTPEFLTGHSLAALEHKFLLREWLCEILKSVSISPDVWRTISVAVVAAELSMAVGLCFKRTRMAALAVIFLFQTAIFATMPSFIMILHLAIFVCCLSFFDQLPAPRFSQFMREKNSQTIADSNDKSPGPAYFACAAIAACLFLALPLRIYLIDHAFERLSLMDRRPWTFCMFVCQEANYKTSIWLRHGNGQWQTVPPRGRMCSLSSDSDLRALAHYFERAAPSFDELKIESFYETNGHLLDRKVLIAKAIAPGRFKHKIEWARQTLK